MYESMDILILAFVAGFIIFKLYNILGQGDEELLPKRSKQKIIDIIPLETLDKENFQENINEVDLQLSEKLQKIINQIKLIDNEFNEAIFLQNATKVFEIIIAAYSNADTLLLKKLLSKEVYIAFFKEIESRKSKNEVLDKTLVSIVKSELIDVSFEKKQASISVKFISQQINLIKNNLGQIISGDPKEIDNINEIWTFSRNLGFNDLNWKLIETRTA